MAEPVAKEPFSGTVDIQGQFIVDDDVVFISAQVYMEPGAEIVVEEGWMLDVVSSTFESCNNVMWKGIVAGDSSTVRMQNSFVDDAENAITGLDGSTLWLRGNQFHNNRVALHVPQAGGTAYNDVSVYVNDNTFYSQDTMPQPYPGQATAIGAAGFAAADVHHTSLDFTGGGNIVHTLSNGIVAHQSDVVVNGCRMLRIQPDPAYAYTGNGAGIYARGDSGLYIVKQQGYGTTTTASFDSCRWGIFTEYMSLQSTDNRMVDMGTAYRVDRSGLRSVDILANTVSTYYHGMDLRTNDGAAHILIENNDITFGANPACTTCKGYCAITVSEGNYTAQDSRIMHNTIRYLAVPGSRFGVFMNATADWLVAENDLRMASNAHNRTGIELDGCTRPTVSCNTVRGGPNDFSQDAQAAIRNSMGSDALISCNDVDSTANGILFNGAAPNTDVRGNKMRFHRWALHLDSTAVIGTQSLAGNLWYSAAATGGICALYEDSANAPNFPFLVNPTTISGGSTMPSSVWPSGWFDVTSGANYDCSDDEGDDYCAQFHERGKEKLTALDELVANDSIQNDPYTAETTWMLKSRLYKKLDDNPDLQDSLAVMAALYDEIQGSTTADFKQIDDEQLVLYDLDSSTVTQLQENNAQIDSLGALVRAGLEQLSDSVLTSAQLQAVLDGIHGYRDGIRDLSTWNTIALQAASSLKASYADDIQATNAAVLASELVESNLKTVNDIYLATIGKDVNEFTASQTSELFNIANQCPMLGGNAVFKARSLYWLIDDDYDFDDASICLPYGIVVKKLSEQHSNPVRVVPNPASDEASLMLTRETDEPAYLTLYNAVGSEVMRVLVPKGVLRHAFSIASIAPGLYQFKVLGPNGLAGDGKLTILR